MNLKSGWYNKKLRPINPNEKEIGAILFVTKDFRNLQEFLVRYNYAKLKQKVSYAKDDLIIDVFNGWNDLTIKIYARVDYKKRHKDYLKVK